MLKKCRVTGIPSWCRIVREPNAQLGVGTPIRSSRDVNAYVRPFLGQQEQEVFVVVLLNAQCCAIAFQEVSRGILNASLVHPREVFRLAIAFNAAAIICAHNHPSGDPTPSADDRNVTNQLVAAGRLLDIPVYDHMIIGDGYTSFADAGLL